MNPNALRTIGPMLAASLLGCAPLTAQCTDQWLPGHWLPNGESPVSYVNASTMWDPDGPGPASEVLVVGGIYGAVASWDPATGDWQILGSMPIGSGTIYTLTALPGGDLVVGGAFSTMNGVAAENIARFDGTNWHAIGQGSVGSIWATTAMANGDLVAAPYYDPVSQSTFIARWDGTTWAPLHNGTINSNVETLTTLANGDILAGGYFSYIGGMPANRCAILSGGTWSEFGGGVDNPVLCFLEMPNGDIIAGGYLTNAGGVAAQFVARFDGSAWTPLGAGLNSVVRDLVAMPNGDIIAAGDFNAPGSPPYCARWNGTSWGNASNGLPLSYRARCMTLLPNGELVVGGEFQTAGGNLSRRLARLAPSCDADVQTYGSTCAGSNGVATLTPLTWPWAGTTFRARGEQLPTTSIVAIVTGFAPVSVPLTAVFTEGQPGCELLVAPEVIDAAVTTDGTLETYIVVPDVPAAIGLPLFHQLIALEIGTPFSIEAATTSTALQLTIASL